jgi:hypothetical protein
MSDKPQIENDDAGSLLGYPIRLSRDAPAPRGKMAFLDLRIAAPRIIVIEAREWTDGSLARFDPGSSIELNDEQLSITSEQSVPSYAAEIGIIRIVNATNALKHRIMLVARKTQEPSHEPNPRQSISAQQRRAGDHRPRQHGDDDR